MLIDMDMMEYFNVFQPIFQVRWETPGIGVSAASFHPFFGATTALVDQNKCCAEALQPTTGAAHGAGRHGT